MKIILKGGEMHEVTELEIRMLVDAYPRIDVLEQLRAMAAWCQANPQKRKTPRGINRFINAWLQRTQTQTPRREVSYAQAHKPFAREKPYAGTKAGGEAGLQMLKEALKK